MRKLFAFLFVLGLVTMTAQASFAQAENEQETTTEEVTVDSNAVEEMADSSATVEEAAPAEEVAMDATADEEVVEEAGGFQVLKEKFIEGGYEFMSAVLIALILGLAFCIERIITLNIASVNTDKLLGKIDERLKNDDLDGAMEVCKSTQGPTASILYEGLKNAPNGAEAVEKSIVAYGGVQMGLLEKGLIWISLFIAIAPMLGFMGTVIGMIGAFDDIEAAGDISPTVVAGGIKVALLTTVFGLIVAIILQVFYNYIVAKIDGIVNKMEDASITLVDIMVENGVFKK